MQCVKLKSFPPPLPAMNDKDGAVDWNNFWKRYEIWRLSMGTPLSDAEKQIKIEIMVEEIAALVREDALEEAARVSCGRCFLGGKVELNKFGVWIHLDEDRFPCDANAIRAIAQRGKGL